MKGFKLELKNQLYLKCKESNFCGGNEIKDNFENPTAPKNQI